MNSADPRPATHLARYGAAIASKGFRVFLRHVWKQNVIFKDASSSPEKELAFDAALQKPDLLFSFEDQRWSELLKRSLQKVARLFSGEEFAVCAAGAKGGDALADVLKAFAPLCAQMVPELQAPDFEASVQEPDFVLLERLHPHLPQGAWLPPLFADLTIAALWREIASEPIALKFSADSAAKFFEQSIKETGSNAVAPPARALEQMVPAFAFQSVEIAVSHLKWMMEPDAAADLEAWLIPFLHKAFSHEPSPQNAMPVEPGVKKAAAILPALQLTAQTSRPASAQSPPELRPLIPQLDEDEDAAEDVERAAVRGVRWLVSGVGIALVAVALLAVFGRGLFKGLGEEDSDDGTETTLTNSAEPSKARPETIVDGRAAPLSDPVAISATPVVKLRLFEQAQAAIEAAARAKASGDNRQSAEELSRALLIFKQDLGDARWDDPRYKDLRTQYRDQLGLLEFSNAQIDAIERTLGAHETDASKAAEVASEPGLSQMLLLFKRGDEELAGKRPRAAAEAYESGLRQGILFLGDKHHTDRVYQAHLSRYIDFLIGEELPPDELQDRLILVKKGRKPGPLPARKSAPESSGLGLPKL